MRAAWIACCLLAACTPDEQNLGFTAVGSPRWAVAFGGIYDDRGIATAIDSIGDVVAVGDQAGPPDEQGLSPISSFVTKRVASDGSERWTVEMVPLAAKSYVDAMSVAIDPQDSVIVTGNYIGSIDFGGQTLTIPEPTPPSHSDTFVAKYSWDGHLLWVRGFDQVTSSEGLAVAVDSTGRILVAGVFGGGTLAFGSDHITAGTDPDAYLVALDPAGTALWGRAFQGTAGPGPHAVAITAEDDIVVVGDFAGSASFGGATLDAAAQDRGFVARYRKDGLYLWSEVIGLGGNGTSLAAQVATGPTGIVVQTQERDDFSLGAHTGLHVLDDAGHEKWSATIEDNGRFNPQMRSLSIAPSGVIVSSAWTDSTATVSGAMEVVSYDPRGHADTTSFGSRLVAAPNATLAWASAAGSTGAIAYTGVLSGTLDFGTGPLASHSTSDSDVFIVLLDPP